MFLRAGIFVIPRPSTSPGKKTGGVDKTSTLSAAANAIVPGLVHSQITLGSDQKIDISFDADLSFFLHPEKTFPVSLDPRIEALLRTKFSPYNFQTMEERGLHNMDVEDFHRAEFTIKYGAGSLHLEPGGKLSLITSDLQRSVLIEAQLDSNSNPELRIKVLKEIFEEINKVICVSPTMLRYLQICLVHQAGIVSLPGQLFRVLSSAAAEACEDPRSEVANKCHTIAAVIERSLPPPTATLTNTKEIIVQRGESYRYSAKDKSDNDVVDLKKIHPAVDRLAVPSSQISFMAEPYGWYVLQTKAPNGCWLGAYDVKAALYVFQKHMPKVDMSTLIARFNQLIRESFVDETRIKSQQVLCEMVRGLYLKIIQERTNKNEANCDLGEIEHLGKIFSECFLNAREAIQRHCDLASLANPRQNPLFRVIEVIIVMLRQLRVNQGPKSLPEAGFIAFITEFFKSKSCCEEMKRKYTLEDIQFAKKARFRLPSLTPDQEGKCQEMERILRVLKQGAALHQSAEMVLKLLSQEPKILGPASSSACVSPSPGRKF